MTVSALIQALVYSIGKSVYLYIILKNLVEIVQWVSNECVSGSNFTFVVDYFVECKVLRDLTTVTAATVNVKNMF